MIVAKSLILVLPCRLVESVGHSEVLGTLRLGPHWLWQALHGQLNVEHLTLLGAPDLLEILDPLLSELARLE